MFPDIFNCDKHIFFKMGNDKYRIKYKDGGVFMGWIIAGVVLYVFSQLPL